jgi:hypothetical protein
MQGQDHKASKGLEYDKDSKKDKVNELSKASRVDDNSAGTAFGTWGLQIRYVTHEVLNSIDAEDCLDPSICSGQK